MSVASQAPVARLRAGVDLSGVILVVFALVLCVLIVLPLSWLGYYSVVDRTGAFTLANFRTLVTDPVFLDPLITTVILATSSAFLCCAVAAPACGATSSATPSAAAAATAVAATLAFMSPPGLVVGQDRHPAMGCVHGELRRPETAPGRPRTD